MFRLPALARGLAAIALTAAAALHAQTPDVPAAAQKSFAEAQQYEQQHALPAARDSYAAALKAAGNHCVACLDALIRTQLRLELYKDAADSATQLAAQATTPQAKAQAESRAGLALFELYFAQTDGRGNVDKNPRKAAESLRQAEAQLARAEADDPSSEQARMLHGRMLAALKRDDDATREFQACAASPGVSPQECARAQHFAHDASIARNEPSPSFTLKTIDGKTVSLDTLAGKVVLIDFWTTWCSVCARDADYIQSTVDIFDDKKFVLLEVSGDESLEKWRSFVNSQRLEGLQTHDDTTEMQSMFHVGGFPTYVVLDADGVIRLRAVGIEGDIKGTVRKLLAESSDTPANTSSHTGN
jgi:peroxiredoxin